jgi:hypothetical protein
MNSSTPRKLSPDNSTFVSSFLSKSGFPRSMFYLEHPEREFCMLKYHPERKLPDQHQLGNLLRFLLHICTATSDSRVSRIRQCAVRFKTHLLISSTYSWKNLTNRCILLYLASPNSAVSQRFGAPRTRNQNLVTRYRTREHNVGRRKKYTHNDIVRGNLHMSLDRTK